MRSGVKRRGVRGGIYPSLVRFLSVVCESGGESGGMVREAMDAHLSRIVSERGR